MGSIHPFVMPPITIPALAKLAVEKNTSLKYHNLIHLPSSSLVSNVRIAPLPVADSHLLTNVIDLPVGVTI